MKNTSPRIVTVATLQFVSWLAGANKVLEDHRQANFSKLPKEILVASEGGRYIKVSRVSENVDPVTRRPIVNSAYGFIDRTNGDVLMAASWRAPAKHARGNIFSNDNGLPCVGPYGIAYLR
jgi:hypothetical protein